MKQSCFLAALLLVALSTRYSYADLVISTAASTGDPIAFNATREWGFDFTVGANDVRLLRLGAYDQGQDGLSGTVRVSVWDRSDTNLLVSADITAGTLDSNWRMVSVSPITLSANGVYSFVASTITTGDDSFDNFTPIDATSLGTVSIGTLRWEITSDGALKFPNETSTGASNTAFMGGVNADIVAVPEPSSFAAVGLSGCAIWVIAFGRRKISQV